MKKFGKTLAWLLLLGTAQLLSAQLKVGDNLDMSSNGTLTFGYNGSYGDNQQSTHGLQTGLGGNVYGSYYNPNFLNFNVNPYYNHSQANSESQSVTASSGVNAIMNLFSGSHFPGNLSYDYVYNNTENVGLPGLPAYASVGRGQSFGIGWSALVPDLPTLSVGYSQGSGSGNVYGTKEETQTDTRNFNARSSYNWEGFNLNAGYLHQTQHTQFPLFLGGNESVSDGHSNTFNAGASHRLPWEGQMFANYSRNWFAYDNQGGEANNTSRYTANNENAGLSFHPTSKLTLSASETYTDNLSGYLLQQLGNSGVLPQLVNLGASSNSFTVGGGAGYAITSYLYGTVNATHYNQHYSGQTFAGTYLSGTLSTWKKLWDTFSFSATVIDSANQAGTGGAVPVHGQGDYHNNLAFTGTVNGSRRLAGWELNGNFSYTQNAQWQLITYTISQYSYGANIHRRFQNRLQWAAAFAGSRSGLTQDPGTSNRSESYSTSLFYRRIGVMGNYNHNTGVSVLTPFGLVPLPPLPGEINPNDVFFSGRSYGGGINLTPVRRMTFAATYTHSLSDTLAHSVGSHNNMSLVFGQLQYRVRRINFLAGYTRFLQGLSAAGSRPQISNSFYAGISRWFDFF